SADAGITEKSEKQNSYSGWYRYRWLWKQHYTTQFYGETLETTSWLTHKKIAYETLTVSLLVLIYAAALSFVLSASTRNETKVPQESESDVFIRENQESIRRGAEVIKQFKNKNDSENNPSSK
ncbi:MAG: hypothetical protein ACPG6P_07410, partial [Akkermansiaceae bacterium]